MKTFVLSLTAILALVGPTPVVALAAPAVQVRVSCDPDMPNAIQFEITALGFPAGTFVYWFVDELLLGVAGIGQDGTGGPMSTGFFVDESRVYPPGSPGIISAGMHTGRAVAGDTTAETVFLVERCPVRTVQIVVKPGSSDPAPIGLRSRGRIPVAVLSTLEFNAPTDLFWPYGGGTPGGYPSPRFGRTGFEASLVTCTGDEDVNGDGLLDLLCSFDPLLVGLQPGDSESWLVASGADGIPVEGQASLRTVP